MCIFYSIAMDHFDRKAKTWDISKDKQVRAKVFADEIIAFLPSNGQWNALEFGCGTGLLSFALKDAMKNITLVDTSEGMIAVLEEKIKQQRITNFKPLQVDLLADKTEIAAVDIIYTLMTLHHILDLDRAFSVFHDLLNVDGYLCIADLVEEDGTFHKPELNFDGHHGFNKSQLSDRLRAHGFAVAHYSTPHVITKENGKRYPLFLLIAKKLSEKKSEFI